MTDTNRDDPLEWHVVFDDGDARVLAADLFDGVLLELGGVEGLGNNLQFIPGLRVRYEPEMDRARLVRR